jgi:hypothetical protein
MRAVVFGLSVLLAVVVLPVRGDAQMPAPGAKVRVATDSSRVTGVLTASTADSMRIALSQRADTISVARSAIREVAVASGKRRHTRQGLMYGALAGAVIGGTAGFVSFAPCTDTGFLGCYLEPETRGQATAVGAGVGAVLGTALGAIVGAFTVGDRWTVIPSLSVR